MKCTTTDGNEIRISLDHVVTIRPYQRDRGEKGSEITFAGGSPSSLVVREDQDRIASSRQKSTTDRLEAEPRQIAGWTSSERKTLLASLRRIHAVSPRTRLSLGQKCHIGRLPAPSTTDGRNRPDQGAS
jgi:hypothetical protein